MPPKGTKKRKATDPAVEASDHSPVKLVGQLNADLADEEAKFTESPFDDDVDPAIFNDYGSDAGASENGVRASWSANDIGILLAVLCKMNLKKKSDTAGYAYQEWTQIEQDCRSRGLSFSKDQIQSKYSYLKKQYEIFKALKDLSGAGYDERTGIVSLGDWTSYLKKHPDAKQFRNKPCPHYAAMEEAFGGFSATGAFIKPMVPSATPQASTLTKAGKPPVVPPPSKTSSKQAAVEAMQQIATALTSTKKPRLGEAYQVFGESEFFSTLRYAQNSAFMQYLKDDAITEMFLAFNKEDQDMMIAEFMATNRSGTDSSTSL